MADSLVIYREENKTLYEKVSKHRGVREDLQGSMEEPIECMLLVSEHFINYLNII